MHLISNAQLEIIDDGYLFLVTRPVETAGIIKTFLSRLHFSETSRD